MSPHTPPPSPSHHVATGAHATPAKPRKRNDVVRPKEYKIPKTLNELKDYAREHIPLLTDDKYESVAKKDYQFLGQEVYRAALDSHILYELQTICHEAQSRDPTQNVWKLSPDAILKQLIIGAKHARQYGLKNELRDAIGTYIDGSMPAKNLMFVGKYAYVHHKRMGLMTINNMIDTILHDAFFRQYTVDAAKHTLIKNKIKYGWLQKHDERQDSHSSSQASLVDIKHDNITNWISHKCKDVSPFTLEQYEDDDWDDLVTIRIQDSSRKWLDAGDCYTRPDLLQLVKATSDDGVPIPTYVMASWVKDPNTPHIQIAVDGDNGLPGSRVFVRLPSGMYITIGSYVKIMTHTHEKEWFLKPLYQKKPLRIGNMYGEKTISGNHGQKPGLIVYKAFTKAEIKNKARAIEADDEYFTIPRSEWDHVLFGTQTAEYGVLVDTTKVDNFIKEVLRTVKPKKAQKRQRSSSSRSSASRSSRSSASRMTFSSQ